MRTTMLVAIALAGCADPASAVLPGEPLVPGPRPGEVAADAGEEDAAAPVAGDLALVVEAAGHTYVVLDLEPGALGVGPWDASGTREGELVATRALASGSLDAETEARASALWTLHGDAGACTARLAEPVLIRRAAGWGWEDDSIEPVADMPEIDDDATAALWDLSSAMLVAEAIAIGGECRGALIAHPAEAPPRRVLARARQTLSPEVVFAAREAFAALPRFQALEVDYRDYVAEDGEAPAGSWVAWTGEDTTWVSVLAAQDGTERVVIGAGDAYGCGGFYGTLHAIYARTSRGLELEAVGEDEDAPRMIVETSDGRVIHVATERMRDAAGGEWIDASAPYHGCAC